MKYKDALRQGATFTIHVKRIHVKYSANVTANNSTRSGHSNNEISAIKLALTHWESIVEEDMYNLLARIGNGEAVPQIQIDNILKEYREST